jgi:TM2 domain-containing membrane protein YozV
VKKLSFIFITILLISSFTAIAQTEEKLIVKKDTMLLPAKQPIQNPLAPAKAAFYSAIFPGGGQIYNKKYWKAPIVWGAMGTTIGIYAWNNKKYHEYRDAYKDLLQGKELTGELAGINDPDRLIRAQKGHQKNRDLCALLTVGLYVLQIVEANVNAHLMQFNVNENLSLRPQMIQGDTDYKYNMGVNLSYQF